MRQQAINLRYSLHAQAAAQKNLRCAPVSVTPYSTLDTQRCFWAECPREFLREDHSLGQAARMADGHARQWQTPGGH